MNDKLTTQEQNFVKEVVRTGNKTEAVVKAYKEKDSNYAGVKGNRLIRKDKIQKAIKPIVDKWIAERDRLTAELESRDLSEEKYETVIKSIDLITKNIQLITGKATENIAIATVSEEDKRRLDFLLNDKPKDTQGSN